MSANHTHIPRSEATIFSAMGWYMFLASVNVSRANVTPPSALDLDNDRYNGLRNFMRPCDVSMSLAGSNAPASPAANLSCSHLQRISLFFIALKPYSSSRDLTTLTERAWDPPRYSISDRRKWSICADEKSLTSSADAPTGLVPSPPMPSTSHRCHRRASSAEASEDPPS